MGDKGEALAATASASAPKPDSGLVSLALVARFHGKAAEADQLRHELGLTGAACADDLLLAAKRLELRAKLGQLDLERAALGKVPLPCIVELVPPDAIEGVPPEAEKSPSGFAVLAKIDAEKALLLLHDPVQDRPSTVPVAELKARLTGRALFITPHPLFALFGLSIQRKTAIKLCVWGLIFLSGIFLLYYFHFFQTRSDIEFQNKLISVLKEKEMVLLKDLERGEWDEVCIMPRYHRPEFKEDRAAYNDQLNDHMGRGIVPYFISNHNHETAWWIFFADAEKKVKRVIQLDQTVNPSSGTWKSFNADWAKASQKFNISFVHNFCAARDTAAFVVADTYVVPVSSKRFYYVFFVNLNSMRK